MLLSAALHAAVLFVSRYFISVSPPPAGAAVDARAGPPEPSGMRVYRIAVTPEAELPERAPEQPEQPEQPERALEEPPTEPEPAREADADADAEEAPAESRRRGPVERLRPRRGDARLWALPEEIESPELSDEERLRLRIYGRLTEFNDSASAAAAARRQALDWTIEGEDGQRWGISPDGIHLGDITLPAPTFLSPSPEARARMREWDRIQQQADRARIRSRFDERVEALRERKDEERQKQNGSSGSGSSDASAGG